MNPPRDPRPLTAAERAAFLRRDEAATAERLRRLRDEATACPELLATHGFAWPHHPDTEGLMSYRDDEIRRAHWLAIRDENAARATGGRDVDLR